MSSQLQIYDILRRAKDSFSDKEVVSVEPDGMIRYSYGDFYERVCRAANMLRQFGVSKGDRVGTLACNSHRHLELYFAVPCSGAVLNTLNMRLSEDQLVHVINQAKDKVLFLDPGMVRLVERIAHRLETVKRFIVLGTTEQIGFVSLDPCDSYDDCLKGHDIKFDFPDMKESDVAALCYTSATTGYPKGVEYTHKSIVLHSWATAMADTLAVSESDSVLPIVPMFHVNAWGLPYSAALMGSKLVLPGSDMTPEGLCSLIEKEGVTLAAGVPTIWRMVLSEMENRDYDLSSLRMIVNGGAPLTIDLLQAYQDRLNVTVSHAFGMTETAPMVSFCRPLSKMEDWPNDKMNEIALKQGQLVPGIQMRIVDIDGSIIEERDKVGELQLKGYWVADSYYMNHDVTVDKFTEDGWFRTQDMVTVDSNGYIQIVDRAQDLIKSGGEWISSVELENEIIKHPAVKDVTVVAVKHEKWDERPVAFIVLHDEKCSHLEECKGNEMMLSPSRIKDIKKDIRTFLCKQVAKFWIPDEFYFLESIPKTSVGKYNKKLLREQISKAGLDT